MRRKGGLRTKAGEELVLRTIAQHAESLLRTARRYSICVDDAHDAYQRALEIFLKNADRLDAGRAGPWLHAVVRNEAISLREQRKELVAADDVDFDQHQAIARTPDEHVLTFDMLSRSAEALQSLKPQEVRALWLRAQGHSYSDIGAITGWSYTKVNRCLAEGRQSFLRRYSGIESGEECKRWAATLTAIVDGEVTPEQMNEVRPHLRNCAGCRATLAALRDSDKPIAAVLPVPLIAAAGGGLETLQGVLVRAHDAVAGSLANSTTKVQAVVEASATGKVAAVAASAAAVAGGGYATVEQVTPRDRPAAMERAAKNEPRRDSSQPKRATAPKPPATPMVRKPAASPAKSSPRPRRSERTPTERRGGPSPEFTRSKRAAANPEFKRSAAAQVNRPSAARSPAPVNRSSPEFSAPAANSSPEFAP